MMKIGLAIALGKDANSHTRTFIEAVNYSLRHFPEFKKSNLKIVNDGKSPEGVLMLPENWLNGVLRSSSGISRALRRSQRCPYTGNMKSR